MNTVFELFGEMLETRLAEGVFTTEDSVRYTFFAALLEAGSLRPEQVILEFPHPVVARAEVDTWIPDFGDESIALEFKYDRETPGGTNSPKPNKAGKIFHDLHRLLLMKGDRALRRIFVYLTSAEMTGYMNNPRNGLHQFFSLVPEVVLEVQPDFFRSKSATFQRAAEGEFQANVVSLYSRSLPKRHELRIYGIEPDVQARHSRSLA